MPEENGNGNNGKRVGLLERVNAGVKEDVQSLKTDMPVNAKEQIEGLKDPKSIQSLRRPETTRHNTGI